MGRVLGFVRKAQRFGKVDSYLVTKSVADYVHSSTFKPGLSVSLFPSQCGDTSVAVGGLPLRTPGLTDQPVPGPGWYPFPLHGP